MLTRLFKWEKIRILLIYALYLVAALLLQSLLFSRIEILGLKGMILPAAVVAAAMYLGGVRGAVFGICLGLMTDWAFTDSIVLYTVLFSLIGFGVGFAAEFYLNNSFFAFLLFGIAATLLTGLAQFSLAFAAHGAEIIKGLFTVILQTLVSILPMMLLYLPFRRRKAGTRDR